MKVAVNRCYGGFGISEKGFRRMAELGNEEAIERVKEYDERKAKPHTWDEHEKKYGQTFYTHVWDTPRNDPALIQAIEELGEESWGECDGKEWVSEKHRRW